jgi:hypothetical protein
MTEFLLSVSQLFTLFAFTCFIQENTGVERAGATVAAYLTHQSSCFNSFFSSTIRYLP